MKTILAVDDNQDDLFLLERTLCQSGIDCRLLTAADGVEAEALLDSLEGRQDATLPSLIFTDLRMPRQDGLHLLERVKHKPRYAGIPVVMVSSFDDHRDLNRALDLGAAACLRKPPDPWQVCHLLSTLAGDGATAPAQPHPASQAPRHAANDLLGHTAKHPQPAVESQNHDKEQQITT